jgi:hypothetical protein
MHKNSGRRGEGEKISRPGEMVVGQPQLYCSCCTKLPRCPGLLPARSCSDPTSDSLTSCLHVTHHAPGQPRHDGMSMEIVGLGEAPSPDAITASFDAMLDRVLVRMKEAVGSCQAALVCSAVRRSPLATVPRQKFGPSELLVGPRNARLSGSFSIERVLQPACYKELSHHAQRSPSFTPLAKPTEACSSSLCAASLTN